MIRCTLALITTVLCTSLVQAEEAKWMTLFDGSSMDGWKINENKDSWRLEDGAIVANGDRSHLFYVGTDKPFKDFEFEAMVMTKPNSNAGIYFHTKWQDKDWPRVGIEAQVNNSYTKDPIKTASLYQIKNVNEAAAKDNEWFKYNIRVEGMHVVVKINDKVIVDYTQPEDKKPGKDFTRVLDKGTFALQAHDPGSTVMFKDIRVRRLN